MTNLHSASSGPQTKDDFLRAAELEQQVRARYEQLVLFSEALQKQILDQKIANEMKGNLAAILEVTNDLVGMADKSGRMLYLNQAGRKMLGIAEHKDLATVHIPDFQPPWASDLIAGEGIPTAIREGLWSGESALLSSGGREIPVLQTVLAHKDPLGNLEYFSTIARDITERKRAEEERKELLKEYRTMFDSVPALIWYKDRDNNIVRVNRPAAESMGKTVEQLEGNSTYALYPEEAAKYHADDLDVIRSEKAKLGIIEQVVTQTGEKLWVRTDKVPYRNEHGEIGGVIVFAINISGQKEAEEEVRKLNAVLELRVAERTAQLERSNRELEMFAYVASHDLQEPLRMVSSYMDLLKQRYHGHLDEKANRWIGFAVDGVLRMKQLINDLLEYSRVFTHGKTFTLTDCGAVLKAVLQNLQQSISEAEALITCGELPTLQADPTQFAQVLQNLLSNAIKYRSRDRQPIINVEAQQLEGYWRFTVRDNGIGIEPQYFDKIFVLFQRLHTREEYPGTGIGLTLCKKIIERHGGRIGVESQPGQGSTFFFTLPGGELESQRLREYREERGN